MSKMETYNGNLSEGWELANRAYQLAPDNPEDIANLARTWVLLGDTDEAERLVLEGLQDSEQNSNLIGTHWMTLMVARRFEEADRLVREQLASFGEELPASLKREFDFQLGMIALIKGEYQRAHDLLISSINEEGDAAYSGNQLKVITLAALASEYLGASEEASGLLQDAERIIKRARLNGVDDQNIYYNEAILLTMRSEPARAIEKLREAYNRGFRELWIMDIDGRLEPLRSEPEFTALVEQIESDINRARVEIRSLSVASL